MYVCIKCGLCISIEFRHIFQHVTAINGYIAIRIGQKKRANLIPQKTGSKLVQKRFGRPVQHKPVRNGPNIQNFELV